MATGLGALRTAEPKPAAELESRADPHCSLALNLKKDLCFVGPGKRIRVPEQQNKSSPGRGQGPGPQRTPECPSGCTVLLGPALWGAQQGVLPTWESAGEGSSLTGTVEGQLQSQLLFSVGSLLLGCGRVPDAWMCSRDSLQTVSVAGPGQPVAVGWNWIQD